MNIIVEDVAAILNQFTDWKSVIHLRHFVTPPPAEDKPVTIVYIYSRRCNNFFYCVMWDHYSNIVSMIHHPMFLSMIG